ncbi:MAG: FliH/SctL family protein [Syntrophobacteraceae bacterium]
MSNLLKNNADRVTTFGFPVIPRGDETQEPVRASESNPSESAQQAEQDLGELYRRKLLEIERRSQEIERDAYSKGFEQGEKDGLDYGQKSIQVLSSQMERLARKLEALPEKVLQDYRDWLLRASIGIARQIVGREIQMSPDIVTDLVRELLEEAQQHGTLTVYLNPSDLEIVQNKVGLTPQALGKNFVLKTDRELERGGCRLESSIQLFDGSIAARFENLEKELLDGSRWRQPGPIATSE